ncbi:MAG: precorrin-8X methylmutase [Alphaproteobacteria bacterium]|jgi:precorrin-8X/cobalt-precorrin-8 methylmutase|nr:precorrin-8X methylmutase [Alphaproteobacteria bacterium]
MALFDAYLMVDWSAETRPKTGKDSIWFALAERSGAGLRLHALENPATRHQARERLADVLAGLLNRDKRVLVGFDFSFGYSDGTARAMGLRGTPWKAAWQTLARDVHDDENNSNDRFEAADRLNRLIGHGEGPFWGHPVGRRYRNLAMTKPGYDHGLEEKRLCEHAITDTQPVWKLAGVGSVGGQVMTGLPVVRALRSDKRLRERCRIWPFETGLSPMTARDTAKTPIVLAEIYPSLVTPVSARPAVKDALQVQAIAAHMAAADDERKLGRMFAGSPDLTAKQRRTIEREEAWILGVDRPGTRAGSIRVDVDAAYGAAGFAYLNDGAAIYAESRRIIESETDLTRLPEALRPLAVRLIHTCGMPDIVDDLDASDGAATKGHAALVAGRPIFCDVEMVAKGIIARRLPAKNQIVCKVASKAAANRAEKHHTTRSWAAADLWGDKLEGAVVAIGNAPTALFRLLETIAAGGPRPALVLGMPVGFVGAAESKRALADSGLDYVTVHGRRGGSAMAAAGVNALMGGI